MEKKTVSDAEWFVINNLEEFIDQTRTIVYNKFGQWNDMTDIHSMNLSLRSENKEELDKILSFKEASSIIKSLITKQKNKKTLKTRYCLSNDQFYEIIEQLNTRMISNIINSLVKKDLVESAFDDEINDFVFWIKDTDENKEKPETN